MTKFGWFGSEIGLLSHMKQKWWYFWPPLSTSRYVLSTSWYVRSTSQYVRSTVCPRSVHGQFGFSFFLFFFETQSNFLLTRSLYAMYVLISWQWVPNVPAMSNHHHHLSWLGGAMTMTWCLKQMSRIKRNSILLIHHHDSQPPRN